MNPIAFLRTRIKAHHLSRAGLVALGIAMAFLLFVVGVAVRLLIGPVSLGPFAGSLSAAIDRAVPGVTVKYDQAAVEWERDEGKINLVILGTRVLDRDGRIIAQAPKADISLAAAPILQGKVEVRRLALVGVQLTLVRTLDGGLRLGIGKDKQEEDILKHISDALKKRSGPSTLESFAIRRARLAFYDERTKLFVVAPRTDFRLARAGKDLVAAVDADMEISGYPAHLKAEVRLPENDAPVTGRVALSGLAVRSLAANSKSFAAVKDTALKLDLTGNFVKDGNSLKSADFELTARGAFTVPEVKNGLVRLSQMRVRGHYNGAHHYLVLDDAKLIADKIKGDLRGKLDFELSEAGEFSGIRGDLKIGRLSFAWPGLFGAPVQFEDIVLKGAWQRIARSFDIEALSISGSAFAMHAAGRITLADKQSPGVEMKGSIAPMSARDLVRHWPLGAAQGGRDWIEANMPAGHIGPMNFELHFSPGLFDQPNMVPEAVSVKFPVDGVEVNYIKGLTHLTEVTGTVTLTGTSLTADIVSGRIGTLAAGPVRFTIPDFNTDREEGVITAHMQGPMADVLTLVDMGNLRYPTRFGINTSSAKGDAAIDLSFRVPLLKSVSVDAISMGIKANITGFGLALAPHVVLTDGNIAIQIDNARLHASGSTGIGGSVSRLNLDWTEEFRPVKGGITTLVALKGAVDDTARNALELGSKEYLKGPIGVSGNLMGHRGALTQANLTLDLTPTNVILDVIAVNKPVGQPMSARIGITFGANSSLESETIRVTGPGTSVTANLRLTPGGKLEALQAPNVRIGPQNDFSLNVTRGIYGIDVQLRGHSLDGSRWASGSSQTSAHSQSGESKKADEPFHINARLDRLAMRSGVAMSNFVLDVSGVGERPATMNLSAVQSKNASMAMTIGPSDNGRRLSASVGDMGLYLKGLFGFTSMQGGELDVSANFPGRIDQATPAEAPDYQGKAALKNFRVLNQPFLTRLFAAGSLVGLANLMQGQGIAVDNLEVPFSSKNGVISVHDVRANGPAVGLTADGYIDRPKNAIALKGSMVPLFGLNSVLGNIPLLGMVITSKQGEGIIGVTYSVTGNADEPSVSVNPLSALAPGILRRLFEGRMPNASQAPSNVGLSGTTPPTPQPKPKK